MPDPRRHRTAPGAAVLALVLHVASSAAADERCASLKDVVVPGAHVAAATAVEAHDGLPAYCRVQGVVPRAIRFELRLPLDGWNGKFYMAGCGGLCGTLEADRPGTINALNHGLKRGYAAATTDAGHTGANVADGRWALDAPDAEADWGWRAVTETARVSRDIIRAFYARPAARSYFSGCSTGGRMGLMEAQRFPHDFDGIVAGAPALDYTNLVATRVAWVVQADTAPEGGRMLDRAKIPRVAKSVMDACDAIDGQRDGLIADPRRCDWTPERLACPRGKAGSDCLTGREVAVLDHWYSPVIGGAGQVQYPGGVPKGSEPFWGAWIAGPPGSDAPSFAERIGSEFVRYMAFVPDRGASFDLRQFDFDRDPPRLASQSRVFDATSPDLGAFRDRGGKLIVFHGWADPLVTPQRTLDWYEAMRARMGGDEAASLFARLYLLPGYDHCGIQPGPGAKGVDFDPLPALEAWVERNEAPGALPITWSMTDGTTRVREVEPQ